MRPSERAPSRMSSSTRARNHLQAAPPTTGRDPFSLRQGGLHEKDCSASALVLARKAPVLCCVVLAQVGEGSLRGATCTGTVLAFHRDFSVPGSRGTFPLRAHTSALAESFLASDPGAEPARPDAHPGSSPLKSLPLPLSRRLLSSRTTFGGRRYSWRKALLSIQDPLAHSASRPL